MLLLETGKVEVGGGSIQFSSIQLLSLVWLCDPMDCSTPGIPVHHHLPELAQTHAHWVGDPIQLSHPLLSPYPPALNLSQHQGLFQWVRWPKFWSVSFSISPSDEYLGLISFRMDWLDLLKSKGLSRVFSNTTIQSINFSALSFLYSSTLTLIYNYWKNHSLDEMDLCWQSNDSAF